MTANTMGTIVGLVVGLIITAILITIFNKDGKLKTEYDERQKIVRGRAYKYGFYGMVIANAIMLLIFTSDVDLSVLGMAQYFIPILVGVVVQVTYCIFNDGYVGLNTNMTRFILIMAGVAAFNLFVGLGAQADGEISENGVLQGPFCNLLCAALFLIMAIELIIKKIMDGKTGE